MNFNGQSEPNRREILSWFNNYIKNMSIMDDEEVMMEKLRCSSGIVKNVILGYRISRELPISLAIILPEIKFESLSQGKEEGFDEAGLALYSKTANFSYDKAGYMASLIGLSSESHDTLVFNHAERINTSECRKEWENLIHNLTANKPIKISDEVIIKRPENDLLVLVCTEKPSFLCKCPPVGYKVIDLTDNNLKKSEAIKEYEGYALVGEKYIEAQKPSEKDIDSSTSVVIPQNQGKSSNTEQPTVYKEIDWEERRFQLVKAIVNGKLAGKGPYDISLNDAHINQIIGTANKIIEKLKTRQLK